MVRSPFFILLLFFFFSCEKRQGVSTTTTHSQETAGAKQAKVWQEKADRFYNSKKYDSAFYYYDESKKSFIKEKDTIGNITYNLIQMAGILQKAGEYNASEEMLTEAEKYNLQKNESYTSAIENYYGIIAKEAGRYDEAIEGYKKILSRTKDSLARLSLFNNMAITYMAASEYDKAIPILEKILKNRALGNNAFPDKKARYMDNLGYAIYKSGNKAKGIYLMDEALMMRNKIDDSYGSIESYLHLTDYYKKSNPRQSNEYAKMAYENATKFQSIDERLEALSFLMISDYEKDARKYAHLFFKLNDSIIKIRESDKNRYAKLRYDLKKIKDYNQKLSDEKAEDLLKIEKATNQSILSFFGVLFLIFLIIVIWKYLQNKNRIERQRGIKAVYDTETRISKKLHDELANDVFQVMSFAETQNLENPNKKELLLDNLDKIYGNARNISRENSSIDTGEDFDSELKQMLVNYENGGLKVIIKNSPEINWAKLPSTSKVAVFRVLQELMVNMKKHSQSTIVVISFETIKNALQIKYSDNGIGFSNKLSLKNGLQNAETRIKAINGVITFDTETEKGFKVKITIPN
ncbi:tetratricopeptide repeat protein [Flavobacterium sp. WW92]|uniref:tetratricopeptide repeat-containing sensor histidine kinase n=1 Tax=unclassified Flavobacterium TaxID=196869 RepID=UPI0022259493|nr:MULTISPECIES: tetratricopeptide repeat protein [unclassified Flavobacterium]WDO11877.1 tetratricopeptide repeat protein [Flavobacterium sp. WW92]